MRVLILSAILACAAAAPSGLVAPLIYQPLAIPAGIPTISPGDIQAAAIEAQEKANDLARAAADKAQEIADQAVENVNEKIITDVDQANERSLEVFWSNEEKKWQAIDAVKTAEAQIDGAAASNAELYAKAAVGGAVSYVASVPGVAPVAGVAPVVAAPISPVVYNPYLSAIKSLSVQNVEVKAEEKKEENQEVTVESAVKSAEPEKAEVAAPAEKSADQKAAEASAEAEKKPVILAPSLIASIPGFYRYNVLASGPVISQPIVKYSSIPTLNGIVAPTFLQNVW